MQQKNGELQDAFDRFTEALTICTRLNEQFPHNRQLIEDQGDTELAVRGVREAIGRQSRDQQLSDRLKKALSVVEQSKERPGDVVRASSWQRDKIVPRPSVAAFSESLSPSDLIVQGIVFMEIERFGAAIQCFEEGLRKDPTRHEAWTYKGIALINLGRAEAAIQCFDNALKIKPDLSECWHNKGLAFMKSDENEQAAAAFQKSLRLEPASYSGWFLLSNCLLPMQRYDQALTAVNRAIAIKPGEQEAILLKAGLLQNMTRYKSAVRFCNKMLGSYPQNSKLWLIRGISLMLQNQPATAIISLTKATQLRPDDAMGWSALGRVMCMTGDVEGINYLERAAALDPDNGEWWLKKGEFELQFDRKSEAAASFRKAEELENIEAGILRRKLEIDQEQ